MRGSALRAATARVRPGQGGAALACLLVVLAAAGCDQGEPAAPRRGGLAIADVLGGTDAGGFRRAQGPIVFSFPADHGSHPEFGSEWWYFTGNLEDMSGRPFSYQLTFFRTGLAGAPGERTSAWATRHLWMAHLSLGDPGSGAFHAFERFSRGALGLAGSRPDPVAIWLDDWSAAAAPADPGANDPLDVRTGIVPLRLLAAEGDIALDLRLGAAKPGVLHGDRGLSVKGAAAGNASYYYSLTRMPTTGRIRVGADSFEVAGDSWMDREWSTSALEPGQVGWDWFSLQLSDGRDLMIYLLRHQDGSVDAASSGTLVQANGSYERLPPGSFEVTAGSTWQSPRSGARYPASWQVRLPGHGVELTVRPLMPDQELDLAFRYWEGAVRAQGTAAGEPVTARGFVELTGYADGPAAAPREGG